MGCSASATKDHDPDVQEHCLSAVQIGDISIVDPRKDKSKDVSSGMPPTNTGELWTDPDFPAFRAFDKCRLDNIHEIFWIRPKEMCDTPCMYGDEVTRHDVIQGELHDSWFLSVVAGVAHYPGRIGEIVVDEEYNPGSPDYRGVVHVRLWQFAGWVDVYIDDLIPVRQVGAGFVPVLARCAVPDVMWLTFLSKAFAKLHDGFHNISTMGQTESRYKHIQTPGYAFSCLSGGANPLAINTQGLDDSDLLELFSYSRKCIWAGHFCTSKAHFSKDEAARRRGLKPGQVYTITTTAKVHGTNLFRIRSTHGGALGGWIGSWSSGSNEWHTLEAGTLDQPGEGESWISMQDFYKHFKSFTVCKFKPYIGAPYHQHLDLQALLYGEWKGPSQVGRNLHNRFKNPKYQITIPGDDDDMKTPVIFELVQHQPRDTENTLYAVRLDIYRLDKQLEEHKISVYADITSLRIYKKQLTVEYPYGLHPGTYLLVPHTQRIHSGQFCIRVHSMEPYTCRYIGTVSRPMLKTFHQSDTTIKSQNRLQHDHKELYFPGQWKTDVNAGGSIENASFYSNPQYFFNLEDFCRLRVTLLQEIGLPHYPMSYVVFKIEENATLPLSPEGREDHKTITKVPAGVTYDATSTMSLMPGRYVIIPHVRKAEATKTYCLVIGDVSDIDMTTKAYNTV